MNSPMVKICGMRDPDNIREILSLSPDWMGFIFHPDSPRQADVERLGPWIAQHEAVFGGTRRVGVFVRQSPGEILDITRRMQLHAVQLHGGQSLSFGMKLSNLFRQHDLPSIRMIKAFSIDHGFDFEACVEWEMLVDLFLFDTKAAGFGGSGRKFEWSLLEKYRGSKPFLLAGGIGPTDGPIVHHFIHDQYAGVDLNSRFERAPGIKDREKLVAFLKDFKTQKDDK